MGSLDLLHIHRNDKVHLAPRYLKCMGYKGHRSPVDWSTREGIAVRANDERVSVLWPGRKTLDVYPPRALEKIP